MYPASQTHAVTTLLSPGESESAPHAFSTPAMHHVPAAQGVHEAPSTPLKPGTHVQFVSMVAPAGVLVLSGQVFFPPPWHHAPASHSVHAPPWAPYHPALHVHAEDALLPIGDSEFAGHSPKAAPPTQKLLDAHLVHTPPSSPE